MSLFIHNLGLSEVAQLHRMCWQNLEKEKIKNF